MFTFSRSPQPPKIQPKWFFVGSTAAVHLWGAPHVSKCALDIHVRVEASHDLVALVVTEILIFF